MENSEQTKKKNWVSRLWHFFNLYEKIWLASLILLALALAIILPEEDTNGVSGTIITILYFLDVAIGLTCELLTSKQSRWSFMIYNIVEIIEISIMIILQARFASMAVSIFFWIPIHTASFIVWNRHKDKEQKTKTVVRSLKPWHSVLLIAIAAAWTFGIGYLMAAYGPESDFFVSDDMAKLGAYMDACLSILSIIDGVLLLFRFKEAWFIWYIYIAIETVYNIIFGQWVLLVYKLGYLMNTTYGIIVWTKYIKQQQEKSVSKENINNLNEDKIKILLNKMSVIVKKYKKDQNEAEYLIAIEKFKDDYYFLLTDENRTKFRQYCKQFDYEKSASLAKASKIIANFK